MLLKPTINHRQVHIPLPIRNQISLRHIFLSSHPNRVIATNQSQMPAILNTTLDQGLVLEQYWLGRPIADFAGQGKTAGSIAGGIDTPPDEHAVEQGIPRAIQPVLIGYLLPSNTQMHQT